MNTLLLARESTPVRFEALPLGPLVDLECGPSCISVTFIARLYVLEIDVLSFKAFGWSFILLPLVVKALKTYQFMFP